MTPLAITLVTGNAGKLATAREHLVPLGIKVEQVRLDLDEIQSLQVQEVAMHKAWQAFRALGCPLIVEDSGFGIDDLGGYPGPMIKHALTALGARGIARLADLTATRACRFSSCLVYIDSHGDPRVFTSPGRTCMVAAEPAEPAAEGAWSDLWNVVIPEGGSAPLSALPPSESQRESARWKQESVFRQFGEWLRGNTVSAGTGQDGRMHSREHNFDFPADRIAVRPHPAAPTGC